MGLVIAYYGPTGFPVGIVVSSLVLVLIYVAVDVVGGRRVNSSSTTISIDNGRIGSSYRGSSGSDDAMDASNGVDTTVATTTTATSSDSSTSSPSSLNSKPIFGT
jgi:hypothetical protein